MLGHPIVNLGAFFKSGLDQIKYVYGHELISQTRGSSLSYFHCDGQFSTRQLTDETGVITDTFTYDAFGNLLNRSGATENNYMYTGEQYDPNVGFYYLRARYYNASIGRFLTQDTWPGLQFEPGSLHKYLYCEGNPFGNWDPSGESTIGVVAVVCVIVIIAILVIGLENVKNFFIGAVDFIFGGTISATKAVEEYNKTLPEIIERRWKEWEEIRAIVDTIDHNPYEEAYRNLQKRKKK